MRPKCWQDNDSFHHYVSPSGNKHQVQLEPVTLRQTNASKTLIKSKTSCERWLFETRLGVKN